MTDNNKTEEDEIMFDKLKRKLSDPFVLIPIFILMIGWGYTVGVRATSLENSIKTNSDAISRNEKKVEKLANSIDNLAIAINKNSTITEMMLKTMDKYMVSTDN